MLSFYQTMLKIRMFEERVSKLFADGYIPGFLHLYVGQEAVATGVCSNLTKDDYITSTHRGHGHCIAKGADMNRMMAELFGKETGYCRGKGGSMHVVDVELGILGANGIVGAGLPIAVGAGLTAKNKGKGQVVVSFFGEGATGIGYFHEALNMAAILKLPIIFVCESNKYAEFTPRQKHLPVETVAERGAAYGIKSCTVDGNDVTKVYESLNDVVKQVREGSGPFLVECNTNRWSGHYEGDPQRYRPEGEAEEWRKNDPITNLKSRLIDEYGVTENELFLIYDTVQNQLDKAEDFSKNSRLPVAESTLEDVYA
ncbi:pyruvate dehydrogenase (acetyl-transferring) E1 component subunit alpha [Bacillus sp. V3-13]|uniref:thiamine pyrophosphate-dependent dehydrogenase E1 component subunit alpha n=1 Tax=Bacillus sp. V3-13 TaxID=2053728 RepID=UPI000C78BE08|nr:thiamine pyrophosphate-dependent dehydrogenase E1 component subunit alpha [Bacillus sp. V3-13]PLR78775.1 pyruvate dehydrogenase (acetyl-transferring) E1 component subunit alpha [Bacillus sp. V3-13]